jgi:GTP cyclohydrolase II
MQVNFTNTASLPTKFGTFSIVSFKEDKENSKEHFIAYMGELNSKDNVLTRIHSECLTGDVFTSLKCDCGDQLDESMRLISEKKEGVIIYLKQEGRGIGLFNKVNAYALQDSGQNTIEANHSLGFDTDLRNFDIVAYAINYLKINSVVLLTNNPEKIETMKNTSIKVSNVQPLIIQPNTYNKDYLKVKKEQLNHLL